VSVHRNVPKTICWQVHKTKANQMSYLMIYWLDTYWKNDMQQKRLKFKKLVDGLKIGKDSVAEGWKTSGFGPMIKEEGIILIRASVEEKRALFYGLPHRVTYFGMLWRSGERQVTNFVQKSMGHDRRCYENVSGGCKIQISQEKQEMDGKRLPISGKPTLSSDIFQKLDKKKWQISRKVIPAIKSS
ncbi:hypothetical protein CRM22_006459, partial [Opisthorchis felineus]